MSTDSVPAFRQQALGELVPFAHVRDVERSVKFYEQLGFKVSNAHGEPPSAVGCG